MAPARTRTGLSRPRLRTKNSQNGDSWHHNNRQNPDQNNLARHQTHHQHNHVYGQLPLGDPMDRSRLKDNCPQKAAADAARWGGMPGGRGGGNGRGGGGTISELAVVTVAASPIRIRTPANSAREHSETRRSSVPGLPPPVYPLRNDIGPGSCQDFKDASCRLEVNRYNTLGPMPRGGGRSLYCGSCDPSRTEIEGCSDAIKTTMLCLRRRHSACSGGLVAR